MNLLIFNALSWEQRKLGDVLETVTDYVAAGSFADLAKNVEYHDKPDYAQLVRTMDLKNGFTSSQEVFVDENAFNYLYRVNLDKECIILPNIGNCGEVYYVRPEALPYKHNVLGPNAILVRSETNSNLFLSTLFQAKDFQTKLSLIVSPNGQTKFNKTELKQIELLLPNSEKEQNKIGEYFANLDNLITLHQSKAESWKNKKNQLSTISWEQRKLSEVVTEIKRTDEKSDAPVMMITAENGFINQSERYSTNNAGQSLKKYILLEKGELAYNHGASKLRPYGSCFALTTEEKARIPFVYHCFSTETENSEFLSIVLNGKAVEKQLRRIVSSGARMDGLLNISFDEYTSIPVMLPRKDEQDRIAEYFKNLDHLITLHHRKLNKTQICINRSFLYGSF